MNLQNYILRLFPGLLLPLLLISTSSAHFGMVIPSSNIVTQENREISLSLSFSHPFEAIGMDLVKPQQFYVLGNGKQEDLLATLKPASVMDHSAWSADYAFKRPGVYQFVMEPKPYWEPAEDLFIIHYTKTIVAAYGDEENWNEPAGPPTEIIPLLRPFGNYQGNTFTGKVLMGGKPVPNCDVEIELYDKGKQFTSPSDYHITQVVKTDSNGIFSFTCPQPGWWGFSALNEADYTITGPEKSEKNVEIGAVLWIYFDAYRNK